MSSENKENSSRSVSTENYSSGAPSEGSSYLSQDEPETSSEDGRSPVLPEYEAFSESTEKCGTVFETLSEHCENAFQYISEQFPKKVPETCSENFEYSSGESSDTTKNTPENFLEKSTEISYENISGKSSDNNEKSLQDYFTCDSNISSESDTEQSLDSESEESSESSDRSSKGSFGTSSKSYESESEQSSHNSKSSYETSDSYETSSSTSETSLGDEISDADGRSKEDTDVRLIDRSCNFVRLPFSFYQRLSAKAKAFDKISNELLSVNNSRDPVLEYLTKLEAQDIIPTRNKVTSTSYPKSNLKIDRESDSKHRSFPGNISSEELFDETSRIIPFASKYSDITVSIPSLDSKIASIEECQGNASQSRDSFDYSSLQEDCICNTPSRLCSYTPKIQLFDSENESENEERNFVEPRDLSEHLTFDEDTSEYGRCKFDEDSSELPVPNLSASNEHFGRQNCAERLNRIDKEIRKIEYVEDILVTFVAEHGLATTSHGDKGKKVCDVSNEGKDYRDVGAGSTLEFGLEYFWDSYELNHVIEFASKHTPHSNKSTVSATIDSSTTTSSTAAMSTSNSLPANTYLPVYCTIL